MEFDQDYPKVGEIYPTYGPTYDFLKNDDIRKRRQVISLIFLNYKILNRFVNVVSKHILGERVKKRAKKVKAVLDGAKTREEVRKIVEKDRQRAEYYGVGKKDFVQKYYLYLSRRFNSHSKWTVIKWLISVSPSN